MEPRLYHLMKLKPDGAASKQTVTDTAGGVTAPSAKTCYALGRLETAQIRFFVDGSTATSTNGLLAEIGDVIILETRWEIDNFSAIRTSDTSGEIWWTFSREDRGVD